MSMSMYCLENKDVYEHVCLEKTLMSMNVYSLGLTKMSMSMYCLENKDAHMSMSMYCLENKDAYKHVLS